MANNKRNYAATLVLDTRGSEDSADAMISKVSEIIAEMDGEVKKVENLGVRELTRPQGRDFSTAAYVRIDFESGPDGPTTIKEKLHRRIKVNLQNLRMIKQNQLTKKLRKNKIGIIIKYASFRRLG